jgi:hypothetical protein
MAEILSIGLLNQIIVFILLMKDLVKFITLECQTKIIL